MLVYFLIAQGGKELLMRAHFKLPSVIAEDSESKPPVYIKFEIPYFTVSGIQVYSILAWFNNHACHTPLSASLSFMLFCCSFY